MPANEKLEQSSSSDSSSVTSDSEITSTDIRKAGKPSKREKKRKHVELGEEPTGDTELTGEDQNETTEQGPETEVLSHAALRKLKKAKTVPEGKPSTSSKPSTEPVKRQNSVWVGNLAFKTTKQQLLEFFQYAGEVTRVHLPTKVVNKGAATGSRTENQGFAYVDFAAAEAKTTAISYSERNLDGRRLLIKDGSDFAGRPAAGPSQTDPSGKPALPAGISKFAQKVLRQQKQPAGPTLFMGNLGFEATAESIREMIEAHEGKRDAKSKAKHAKGPSDVGTEENKEENSPAEDGRKDSVKSLKKVRVGTFEDTGHCKGFAFLDFQSIQLATIALTDPRNYSMDGRTLKLEFASPDAVRRGGNLPKDKDGAKTRSNHRVDDGNGGNRNEHASKRRKTMDGRTDGAQSRQKPGAALAFAQREQSSIVPSQGKKIVF